jgi:PKD repeat protein
MKKYLALLALLLVAVWCSGAALAATYHVGSGQTYSTLNDLYASITPGDNDVILVHPGTYGTIAIYTGGGSSQATATVIRAYDPNNKPVFDAAGADNCIKIEPGSDKWYSLDGLEIRNAAYRGVFHVGGGLIVRNCLLDNCQNGLMSGMYNTRDESPGYLIAEYNEFNQCGEGNFRHSCYIQEYWTEFRYNWIHSPAGGIGYKDRSRDSLLEYNLIEVDSGGAGCAISFCGWDDSGMPDVGQRAYMIGNVVTKNDGGNGWLFLNNIRAADGGVSGHTNPGRIYLYNNTFYTTSHTGPMFADDQLSILEAHNNIWHTASSNRIYDQVDGADAPGQVLTSYNNWVESGMSVPGAFTGTVFGSSPGVVSVASSGGDWHLNSSSPCVNAGYNGVDPAPVREYDHPCGYVNRYDDSAIDIGAYEFVGGPPPLTANFQGSPTSGGPPPVTVNFSDLSTGYPTSWSWNFGDSGTSTAQNPSHSYTSIGTYTVSLTVDDGSTQDTETKVDYIDITAAPSVITVYPYSWETYGGDSTVTITSGSLADVEAEDDVYMVAACNTSSQQGSMEFHFSSGHSQSEVSKITVRYDLHGTNSSTPSYLFFMKQGDSSSFTEMYSGTYSTSDQVFTWETTDIATYLGSGGTLITSICGCPQNTTNYSTYLDLISIELQLVGGGPVAPVANFSGNPTSGTAPLTVSFSDLSTNSPTSWAWTFGDSGTSTAQSPSHQYTSAGDYTVGLTATNSAGSDTETKTNYISVSTAPQPPVADFSGSPTSGNAPLTVNFTDLSTNSPTSWSWTFGDSGTSTSENPSHQYTSAGDYTVSLTATNAGGSDTETKTNYISVSTAPPPAPVADFSGSPTSGNAPLTVSFTDLSTNTPTSWSWNFGDSGTSTAENPSHQYTSAGDYTVSLTATNAGGSDTETKTNYISVSTAPPPAPVADFSGSPTSGNAPLTLGFTDLSTNTPTSWSWNFGDSGTSTAQNPSHDYTSAGDYTVSLTATNAGGSDTETKTNYISVTSGGAPTTIFSDGFENGLTGYTTEPSARACYCSSQNHYLINIRSGGAVWRTISTAGYSTITVSCDFQVTSLEAGEYFEVLWYDGSTWSVIDTIADGDPDEDGTWRTYTYNLPAGAGNNANFAVKFDLESNLWDDNVYLDNLLVEGSSGGPSQPVADFSGSPTSGNAPLNVTFTDLSTNTPTSWSWTFGDSGTSTAQNPSHNYTSAGDYTVSLTATNSAGSDTETKTNYISVSTPPPPAPVADFSGSPTSGDYPLTVSFSDLSTNSPTSWSWNFGDSGTSTAENPSHQYTSAGDYTVSLTATNAGGSDTETKTNYISVSTPPPPAPVADFSGSPTSGTAPLSVSFTDLSTNTPTSWSWNFGDSGTSTAQNPSHDYTSAGDYTVSLTATNAGGSDTETKTDYIAVSSGGTPTTIYSDEFTSLDGWTTSAMSLCNCPASGVHRARFRGPDPSMERTISTAGYTSISLQFEIQMASWAPLESGEYMQALWYDGSTWTELVRLTDSDPAGWYTYDLNLPAAAANNPDFAVRFYLSADIWSDEAQVEDLVVEGTN